MSAPPNLVIQAIQVKEVLLSVLTKLNQISFLVNGLNYRYGYTRTKQNHTGILKSKPLSNDTIVRLISRSIELTNNYSGCVLYIDNTANIDLTFAENLPVAFSCDVVQGGSGAISITPGTYTVLDPTKAKRTSGLGTSFSILCASPGVMFVRSTLLVIPTV